MDEEDFVKRFVQLAEGFGYTDRNVYYRDKIYFSFNGLKKTSLYSLLLYRAMEGWNKKVVNAQTGEAMWLQPEAVFAFLGDDEVNIEYSDYQSTKYLTPQEQTLEDALREVLK